MAIPELPAARLGGVKVAFAPVGSPEAENVTGSESVPFTAVSVTLKFAVWPAGTVLEEVDAVMLKSGTGLLIVKPTATDGLLPGLETVTSGVPAMVMALAGIVACISLGPWEADLTGF